MHTRLNSFVLKTAAVMATAVAFSAGASATVLTTKLAVDNGYAVYLASSNNTTGDQFGSGNDWANAYVDSVTLGNAAKYFLHIYGYDQGGLAGLLGEFSLTGSGYHFANGATTLLSGSSFLTANGSGFGSAYTATSAYGTNGVGPWGTQGAIDANAQWVWSGDFDANNVSYFSVAIEKDAPAHVPEPASLGLLGLGLLGLSWMRAKAK